VAFLNWLQGIDRRIVYIAVVIVLLVPLVLKLQYETVPTDPARGFYDAVEKVDPNKPIIICADWDAAIRAENEPQTVAVIEHVMRRGGKFVLVGFVDPQGTQLTHSAIVNLAKSYPAYKEYGVLWADFGFRPAGTAQPTLEAIISDIPKALGKDYKRTPAGDLPVMRGVRSMANKDVPLAVEICGSSMYVSWVNFVYGRARVPVALGVTGVMAPTIFPLLDSKQVVGMMAGAKGAAEYEQLLEKPGMGATIMSSQNFAHLLVVVLIVLGNLGYILSAGSKKARSEA
jgi:hypothetical protein